MSFWWSRAEPPFVEPVRNEDLPACAEIHRASFPNHWDEDELARLLSQNGVAAYVIRRPEAEAARIPLGFIMIRSVADEAEILTVCIETRSRGAGLAGILLRDVMFRLYEQRCQSLFLEVDAMNDAALQLYRSAGFRKVGERKAYYRSGGGDGTALVMRADLR